MNELAARAETVRYCRLLWERRLVTGTSGNVSVLLGDGSILVTPTQTSLRSVDEAALVRTDRSGRAWDSNFVPTSELRLHLAAYEARPDVRAVIHTHPTFCVVWSKTGAVFERDTVGARETLGEVAFTPYFPPGSAELAAATAAAFASGVNTVLMERHGVSAVGPDLETVFNLTDLAEEAARIAYFSKVVF
ncbi:MAG TPA: class II aldolase/adducin family protein [Candidatus Baltobacteraceae bacterium]|nr:class II aldolase/adducin family protein [Candidatus Baltobacteraceae bacterium]